MGSLLMNCSFVHAEVVQVEALTSVHVFCIATALLYKRIYMELTEVNHLDLVGQHKLRVDSAEDKDSVLVSGASTGEFSALKPCHFHCAIGCSRVELDLGPNERAKVQQINALNECEAVAPAQHHQVLS
mmetsp:Transcript_44115/g.58548  ORF Transcript_44115/g.58548 Transcript_44115/m.58548 type:complete len:129 (+) Transcript_44115:61-447(+)